MQYLLVNPFNPQVGNGVNAYYQSAKACLERELPLVEFSNDKNASIPTFQKKVLAFVADNFDRMDVIIEAPETRSATLLLERGYKTHVRLHAPMAICQKYEGKPVDQARFSAELRAIAQAAVVSSPSYGLVREIDHHLLTSEFIVNKNPILKPMPFIPGVQRQYDVIFMGRFDTLKGVHYLDAVLAHLPTDYKVALVGPGARKFQPKKPGNIAFVSDYIAGNQRFEILANARVCFVPSLFENCSMMILEAIAAGVPVVAWRRGGNDEFPADLVKTVVFDQMGTCAAAIMDTVEGVEISKPRVDEVVSAINADFVAGVGNVVDRLSGQTTAIHRSRFVATAPARTHTHRSFSVAREHVFAGKKAVGFTIDPHCAATIWTPLLNCLGVDYRVMSQRAAAHHSDANHPHAAQENAIIHHNWVRNPAQLIELIANYQPDILLTDHASYAHYQKIIKKFKIFNLPVVFTQPGWFPRGSSILLDRWGINGGSSIAALDFEATTGCTSKPATGPVQSPDVLILAQLDNDANLNFFSPRFHSVDSFVGHVVNQLGHDRNVLIAPHPLDTQANRFHVFENNKVKIVSRATPLPELLKQVGHVFTINSPEMLTALNQAVNIYSGGLGLLDNKGVTRSLLTKQAGDIITDDLVGSHEDRAVLIRALSRRQINVQSLLNRHLTGQEYLDEAFSPIAEALLLSRPAKWAGTSWT